MSQPCPHDPEGILPGECYPCRRAAKARDDDKAHLDTTAWLQFKNGLKPPDQESEILAISEMFALQDARSDL